MAGILLLLSWFACWYGLLRYVAHPTTLPVRDSAAYLFSGYLLALALGAWSVRLWLEGVYPPRGAALLLAAFLVVAGQALMVAGRRALPLSTYDLLVRLAAGRPPRRGIGRFVWHPMYVGLFMAVVGSSLSMGSRGSLTLAWFVGAALAVRIAAERWG